LYDVLRSGESPNPDKKLLHESLKTEIERALETLTPREADVGRLYFGLGEQHAMTLEEIGETFDLTRERVRQIKEKAIRRLKHASRSKILKTYLG
jgi:RNA polymerase primary sigma factor